MNFGISGVYERDCLINTKLGIIDKYFIAVKSTYQVSPALRKMVRFSLDNLISDKRFAPADSVFGTFDLILCRNVLIYFSRELQKKVFCKLYTALDRGGWLILGSADSPDQFTQSRLITVDSMNRIFRKKEE